MEHKGGPTVILAKTVKGYGLGSTQARNATAPEKKLSGRCSRGVRAALRAADPREAARSGQALPAFERRAGDGVHARAASGTGRLHAEAGCAEDRVQNAEAGNVRGMDRRIARPRGFDDDGLRQHPAASDEGPGDRQACGTDCPGRGTNVWPRVGDPAGRHLRKRGAEVQAARRGHAALLSRREGRADSRRGHHRGRLDGVLHGRRHRLRELQACR